MNSRTNAGYAVLVTCALASMSPAIAQPVRQPETADPDLGKTLYQDFCAACHGPGLEGEENWQSPRPDGSLPAPPHDATGHTWHHGDDLLFNYTRLGGQALLAERGITNFNSGMPGFEDQLSEGEIWNILAYIKSEWPPRVQEIQSVRTEAEQLEGN